jgi:hypothetical protein
LFKILPVLAFGLWASAAGELLGYAVGEGSKDYYFTITNFRDG